jgi:hypothetical protein
MADDRIRIDALDPTVLPSLLHELPAMKYGLTVKLTDAQLRAVMMGGADNVALALKDLSNTTGPRGKISPSIQNGDANTLTENGTWVLWGTPSNTPTPTTTYIIHTICDDTIQWLTQYAFEVSGDSASDSLKWKRERNSGTWGAWYRIRETEAELDARYLNLNESNANGRDLLLNASALGATLAKIADAAAGRAAIGAAPPLQAAAGVGQYVSINTSAGSAAVLPAGGTWAYWVIPRASSSGLWSGGVAASIAAGGTTGGSASADVIWQGTATRIA